MHTILELELGFCHFMALWLWPHGPGPTQGSYGSGKTWKKGVFLKNSGKIWKTQGIFRPFLQPQGKLEEFYSAKYL